MATKTKPGTKTELVRSVVDRPFSTNQSPRYFYLAPQYKKALNHAIATVVERDGLAIVSGPVGSGKSTLLRYLVDWLLDAMPGTLELGIIYNPSFNSDFQLLKAVCAEFGIDPKAKKDVQMALLREYLYQKNREDKTVCLIIDEAHKLNGAQMELVREFFNFSHNERFWLQTILAGETEPLRYKLKQKKAIRSRATFYDVLGPLTLKETGELIKFRLRVSGLPEDLFTPKAVAAVHEASGGIPRTIVKIGRHVFPTVGDLAPITATHVKEAVAASPDIFGD